jgi:hypothetical protein
MEFKPPFYFLCTHASPLVYSNDPAHCFGSYEQEVVLASKIKPL